MNSISPGRRQYSDYLQAIYNYTQQYLRISIKCKGFSRNFTFATKQNRATQSTSIPPEHQKIKVFWWFQEELKPIISLKFTEYWKQISATIPNHVVLIIHLKLKKEK